MTTALLSVLLLASEAAAVASTATPATAEAVKTDEAVKAERKICKRESTTESRMGSKRLCLTASEWKARQDLSR